MKKSQAAIEFLSTYGWALLSVLIIIGALTYFGIFNTRKMVSDYCSFSQELTCEDYQIHEDGWVNLMMRNNFGKDITIKGFSVSSDEGGSKSCVLNIPITSGNIVELNCNMNAVIKGDKIKVKGNIVFERTGSTNLHNVTGELYSTVQKKGTCTDGVQNCHDTGCETSVDCGGPCGPSC